MTTARLWRAVPLAAFLLLAAVLWRGLALDPRAPAPSAERPVPAFALTRLDDPTLTVRRDDLLGQVWVLNVWASWCGACRAEHAAMQQLAAQTRVPIIGLNHKDTRAAGTAWLRQLGDPYRLSLFDPTGDAGIDLGVIGVPETFVIDRQGVVRLKITGGVDAATIAQRIVPLLKALDA